MQSHKRSLVCGHRGASGHAPENTMEAFQAALEEGADWIEFDVQLSADGELIILHDDTLKRTTSLKEDRRPTEFTLPQLRELDAGGWFGPEFSGARIPTLDQIIESFNGKLGLNIEIKSKPGFEAENGLERKIADLLKRHNLYDIDRVIVSSFDPSRLMALHAYDERVPLGALYNPRELPKDFDPFRLAEQTHARALHPYFAVVNQELVDQAHAGGLLLNTWTVNEVPDMRRMAALGVDIIITNYPAQLKEVVAKL